MIKLEQNAFQGEIIMGSIIDRKINKEITHGLNANEIIGFANNTYTLPNFEKNEKGEYLFAQSASFQLCS